MPSFAAIVPARPWGLVSGQRGEVWSPEAHAGIRGVCVWVSDIQEARGLRETKIKVKYAERNY